MKTIAVKNLRKTYGKGHTAVHAVNDVSLSVGKGEIVLIMGPSGSGKTTLLTILGALLRQTSGTVSVEGQDIAGLSERQVSKWRLRNVGFIFQSFNLLSALTAEQNVSIPLIAARWPRRQARRKSLELLKRLGLAKRTHYLPRDLSGGEKQRVAIARALANDPEVILADEPTANLDSKRGREVMMLLCEIACAEGRTVIIVSHDARLRDIATKVITIEDGKLLKKEVGDHAKNCPHRYHPGLLAANMRSKSSKKRR